MINLNARTWKKLIQDKILNVSVKINGIAKKYQTVLFHVYILYHRHCKQEFFPLEFQFTTNKKEKLKHKKQINKQTN